MLTILIFRTVYLNNTDFIDKDAVPLCGGQLFSGAPP
jgi:hypothetical protein